MIEAAFEGVTLGRGISAQQTEIIDNYGEGVSEDEFNRIPLSEVTQDWRAIPVSELERVLTAHLDAEGFRYYMPALMLRLLDDYEYSSMRVIGTLLGLRPEKEASFWAYRMSQYHALSDSQKAAIAFYLKSLPKLVPLDPGDVELVTRALRDYWHQFIPRS